MNSTTRGTDYRGTMNKTEKGFSCQMWSSQSPHIHPFYTPDNIVQYGIGDHKYCRNVLPAALSRPWCFTTDKNKQWDRCNVPVCKSDTGTKLYQ